MRSGSAVSDHLDVGFSPVQRVDAALGGDGRPLREQTVLVGHVAGSLRAGADQGSVEGEQ
nr:MULTISPECIES: hypothetical protein [Rhodococcus]